VYQENGVGSSKYISRKVHTPWIIYLALNFGEFETALTDVTNSSAKFRRGKRPALQTKRICFRHNFKNFPSDLYVMFHRETFHSEKLPNLIHPTFDLVQVGLTVFQRHIIYILYVHILVGED
jgi:hypothetical protein